MNQMIPELNVKLKVLFSTIADITSNIIRLGVIAYIFGNVRTKFLLSFGSVLGADGLELLPFSGVDMPPFSLIVTFRLDSVVLHVEVLGVRTGVGSSSPPPLELLFAAASPAAYAGSTTPSFLRCLVRSKSPEG